MLNCEGTLPPSLWLITSYHYRRHIFCEANMKNRLLANGQDPTNDCLVKVHVCNKLRLIFPAVKCCGPSQIRTDVLNTLLKELYYMLYIHKNISKTKTFYK